MEWWKEIAKMCLNFAVLTVGAISYSTLTGRWNLIQFCAGLIVSMLWIIVSRLMWQKGVK